VEGRRVVGERHLKLMLKKDGRRYEAMRFNALDDAAASGGQQDPPLNRIRAAYRLAVNEFNGLKNVQINVEHIE
jgi:single-stranded-DNA-specific exonuclease